MEEVLKVGQAEGVNITQNDVEELMGVYKNYPAGNTCSMLQDLLKGARTENDMFCGYVVELGKKHGIGHACQRVPVSSHRRAGRGERGRAGRARGCVKGHF